MRLTKDDKAAFVRAVIDDIPTINYDDLMNLGWPKDAPSKGAACSA